jgi:glycosyltransferase involved in cell wall biosynthesis
MNILKIYSKKNKLLLIGPYPPPLGGVSVHLKRLKELLEKNNYKTDVFYTSRKNPSKIINSINLLKIILHNNYDIIHIHGYYKAFIILIFICKYQKKYKIFYTDHNPRLFSNKNKIHLCLIRVFIKKLDYLIVVANHILKNYRLNRVNLPKNVLIQNAFLPPIVENEYKIIKAYPPKIKVFISEHKPLIIATAWKINFFNKIDLYGLDICIELTWKLKKNFPQIGFLFGLANKESKSKYIAEMEEMIIKKGISKNFQIIVGQNELWPLFKVADLIIRPTVTDGDSLSIRESLYFNCPVVASNVVSRPKGTITFKSRDINDLINKVTKILNSHITKYDKKHSKFE